jgi:hypothetical protein
MLAGGRPPVHASEIGEREFDRLTASEAAQGARTDLTSTVDQAKFPRDRAYKLGAINCAPEVIQRVYDQDLLGGFPSLYLSRRRTLCMGISLADGGHPMERAPIVYAASHPSGESEED